MSRASAAKRASSRADAPSSAKRSTARGRTRVRAARNEADAGSAVVHQAGSNAPRISLWRPPAPRPNAHLASLSTIRDRSQDSYRNNGFSTAIIEKLVTSIIGTGIWPLSLAPDAGVRASIKALFSTWSGQCDADGLLDFAGLQAQAVRGMFLDGDHYTRTRQRRPGDGLAVPLQLQGLSAVFCPHTHNTVASNGNKIRAGIEFDGIGRRVAYYFHPTRPEYDDIDLGTLRRIDAETVAHLYIPLQSGQLRGLPLLTQALIKLHHIDKYDDATLMRQELSNMFAAFVRRQAPALGETVVDPFAGNVVSGPKPPLVVLEPGTAQELAPGEEIEFSEPPDPPTTYADFMRANLRAAAIAADVPYEVVSGDMNGMNDRLVRVVLNVFKRRVEMLQFVIVVQRYCRPVFAAWMDRAVLSGAITVPGDYWTDPETWRACKWMTPRWAYINPVQDVEADKAAIRAGFTSRTDVVAEYGEDAEQVDRQIAEDNKRADELNLQLDTDPRYTSNAGVTQARPDGSSFPSE